MRSCVGLKAPMLFLMICICSSLIFLNIQAIATAAWTPTFYDVFIVSAGDGWAVGEGGFIAHGYGETWEGMESATTLNLPTILDLYSIFMVSANDGWTVGEDGVIVHWDGESWSSVESPTSSTLRGISMVSSTEGWAVGIGGTSIYWNGTDWFFPKLLSGSRSTNNLYSVFALNSNEVYAAGAETTVTILQHSEPAESNGGFYFPKEAIIAVTAILGALVIGAVWFILFRKPKIKA